MIKDIKKWGQALYDNGDKFENFHRDCRTGQVMILSVIMLGGLLLSASAIAGLLLVYQIRQANDSVNSAKAIFAADAGIEWQTYVFFKAADNEIPEPEFSNGASTDASFIYDEVAGRLAIRATGFAGRVVRALETVFTP